MLKKIVWLIVVLPLLTNCSLIPLPQEAREALDEIRSDLKHDSTDFSYSEIPNGTVRLYVENITRKLSNLAGVEASIILLSTDSIQGTSSFDSPQIVITRGMLNSISSEAELAAVISHEIGHKALHHAESPKDSAFVNRAVSKGITKVSGNEGLGDEVNSYRHDLMWSFWSQSQEQAADEYAVKLCNDAGYMPNALPELLDRLSRTSGNTLVQRLTILRHSHKSLSSRAIHLRRFIANQKFIKNKGTTHEQEYRETIQSLYSGRNKVDQASQDQISQIKSELESISKQRKKVSVGRFIAILSEISQLAKKNKIDLSKVGILVSHQKGHGFMEEATQASTPFWDFSGFSLSDEIKDTLLNVTRIGVSFIPVVNNVAALYEVLAGKDFISQKEIGIGGRALSALGLAMLAGPEWRMVASGVERSLASEGSLAKTEVEAIQKSIHIADEVREESNLYGRSRLGEEFNHYLEKGPLEDRDAQNFMGSKYREVFPRSGEKFYRVGDVEGNWWSRIKPTSQIRTMSENAILPEWNNFKEVSELTIPKSFNEPIYEGLSSSMGGKIARNGNYAGNFFHGGGNQIFIDNNVIKALVKEGSVTGGKF